MRIHHIGIAVSSLAEASPVFELLLGKPPGSEEIVRDQKVRVRSFPLGSSSIELLEAASPDSPIARSIARRGAGVHHVTLEVKDLRRTLARLAAHGVRLIDMEPRRGAGNTKIAFVHPSSAGGVLVELIEERTGHRKRRRKEGSR